MAKCYRAVPTRVRDKNSLLAALDAQPAFYLCNGGTEESIYDETGEDPDTIAEVSCFVPPPAALQLTSHFSVTFRSSFSVTHTAVLLLHVLLLHHTAVFRLIPVPVPLLRHTVPLCPFSATLLCPSSDILLAVPLLHHKALPLRHEPCVPLLHHTALRLRILRLTAMPHLDHTAVAILCHTFRAP